MTVSTLPSSPHAQPQNSVSTVMLKVIYALIPGIFIFVIFFGWGIIINLLITLSTALATEALMLKLRKRPITPFLLDGSATVTALLLALALPTFAPWWLAFLGTGFAIIVAKHLYGGLGYNPFNPAMVGYAMLLIAFPREMTAWLPPIDNALAQIYYLDWLDSLRFSLFNQLPIGVSYDSITMATPLDTLKTQLGLNNTLSEIQANYPLLGYLGGRGWEGINLAFLIGGLWLIYQRIISWHIPCAMLAGLFISAAIFSFADPDSFASPLFHLFSGATMLGAFFIATDPVTAATTPRGKLVYGAGIGILIYVIRTWGGYPDAVAFSVLLMNMAVPTIDYYTQPRVFGYDKN